MSDQPSADLEMGPIDYLVIEWRRPRPGGHLAEQLLDLVDRGLVRVLDLAFVVKDDDGTVAGIDIGDLGDEVTELTVFEGASSGLLSGEDLQETGAVLEPGSAAAVLVYENTWAAPFATALRRSGAEIVASGRIPVQSILAALDAAEANA
jgi:hypothetical protein